MDRTRVSDHGVTLIEMLVVLSLIGVSAGIISYSIPSRSSARTVQQEAAMLVARLNLAGERSLINGRHFRFEWQATHYQFEQWGDGAWTTAPTFGLNEPHAFLQGIVLSDRAGGQSGSVQMSPQMLGLGGGLLQLRLEGGENWSFIVFDGIQARLEGSFQ